MILKRHAAAQGHTTLLQWTLNYPDQTGPRPNQIRETAGYVKPKLHVLMQILIHVHILSAAITLTQHFHQTRARAHTVCIN